MSFTAAIFMAALLRFQPADDHEELRRLATIAVAAETVVNDPDTKWGAPKDELWAAILTAVHQESTAQRNVHDGTLRGKAGEVCLMQIHPRNRLWPRVAETLEHLVGTDLESTVRCLRAGALTLESSRGYCAKRNYKTNWRQAMWTQYHYGSKCWLSPHAQKRTREMLGYLRKPPEPYAEFDSLRAEL